MSDQAAPATHYVHLWVRGHYSGSYDFPSNAEAEADADERRSAMGVLGILYVVTDSEDEPGVLPKAAYLQADRTVFIVTADGHNFAVKDTEGEAEDAMSSLLSETGWDFVEEDFDIEEWAIGEVLTPDEGVDQER